MAIFYLIWMIVLPVIAIVLLVLIPVVWFFVVPKLARKLTWARFKKCSIAAIADDAGWVDILVSNLSLPEGVIQDENGDWRFLPRPKWTAADKDIDSKKLEMQHLTLRKFILKGIGKPFWYGYAGTPTLANPATLATLQQEKTETHNPSVYVDKITKFADELPKHFSKPLKKMVTDLEMHMKAVKVQVLDSRLLKEVLPNMVTTSQVKWVAQNREMYGMEKKGQEYGKLAMSFGLIIGLVVIAIVAIMALK